MAILRLQCEFMYDSAFPRDRMVINPHFRDDDVTTSPQDMCNDLAAALVTWGGSTGEVRVTSYDAQGTIPVFPQGDAERGQGVAPTSTTNREVALCLSYYSEVNRPRYRGRLYLPCYAMGMSTAGARPALTAQTKASELVPILADLGGTEVDWCVWSRRDAVARPVTNWWVDNAFDVVRSRGLRATSRLEGTAGEA